MAAAQGSPIGLCGRCCGRMACSMGGGRASAWSLTRAWTWLARWLPRSRGRLWLGFLDVSVAAVGRSGTSAGTRPAGGGLHLSEPRLAGRESNDALRNAHRRPGRHSTDGRVQRCSQLRGEGRCLCFVSASSCRALLGLRGTRAREIPEPLLLVGPRAGQLRSHSSLQAVPSLSQCRQCSMISGLFGTSV